MWPPTEPLAMSDTDPAYYDAVDEVIEENKEEAEWDPDEMRAALLDVAKGTSQSDAAEQRDFSQPLLSQRFSDVEDKVDEIRYRRENGSGLFRNPLEEAIEGFEDFFDEMNDKYEMGIGSRAVQMMVDEIQDAEQLPAPMYVDKFLRQTKSGVSGADVDYIRRRYEGWLQNFEVAEGPSMRQSGGGSFGNGSQVPSGQTNPGGMSGGVPVGGAQSGPPSMQGGQQTAAQQQPHAQHPQQPAPQQGGPVEDPRVDELQEQVEQLSAAIGEVLSEDESQPENLVTVETDDGVTAEMSMDKAVQLGYIGDNDDGEGFIEKLEKAKQMGIIPDNESESESDAGSDLKEMVSLLEDMGVIGDDDGSDMAEAIESAISDLGKQQLQAQQQMSQNFTQVVEEMRDLQEDDDEDMSSEEIVESVVDELKEDEVDRLERQMDSKFSQLADKIEDKSRRETVGEQDPDFLKTDREMEFREKQLESLNENVQRLPQAVASSVKEGIVPAIQQLQTMDDGGNPLWSPPAPQQRRGEPAYTPSGGEPPAGSRTRQQQAQRDRSRAEQSQGGYPSGTADNTDADSSSRGTERADEVREKIGLADDAEPAGAES